jgi:hypothetical protein
MYYLFYLLLFIFFKHININIILFKFQITNKLLFFYHFNIKNQNNKLISLIDILGIINIFPKFYIYI